MTAYDYISASGRRVSAASPSRPVGVFARLSKWMLSRVGPFWFLALILASAQAASAGQSFSSADRISRHENQIGYFLAGRWGSEQTQGQTGGSLSSSVVADDLRMSESVSPATFSQSNVSVCSLGDGSIIVAWQDGREGAGKIYLQRYNALGVPQGSNFKIAERIDGYNLVEPEVVATVSNKFYLAFRDEAAGAIRCLRINSDLSSDAPEISVGDPDPGIYSGPYSIDSRSTGELVVAYEALGAGNDIRVRMFSAAGVEVGSPVTVNSDGLNVSHWSPSVVFDEFGGFAVAWEDYRSGAADIYLRRFDSTGAVLASEDNLIDVSDRDRNQYLPSVVYSPIHGFLTAWTDLRDGADIFLQRFSKPPGGALVGSNVELSGEGAGDSLTTYLDVDLSTDPNGFLGAVYCSYGFSDRTLAQRFDGSINRIGAPEEINTLKLGLPESPALVISSAGRYALCWSEISSGLRDVYFALYDETLTSVAPNEVKTHDDVSGAISDQASLAVTAALREIVVFRDQRNDGGDIYIQSADLTPVLSGSNIRANQDDFGAWQGQPFVAANGDNFLVAWRDHRAVSGITGSRIFVRYGNRFGTFDSNEFLLSGSVVSPKAEPSAALGVASVAMVVWVDFRLLAPRVYGKILKADRTPLVGEFPVSVARAGVNQTHLTIATDRLNRFRVSWLESGGAVAKIESKLFGISGALLGGSSFVSDQSGVTPVAFAAASDSSGNYYILWQGVEGDGTRRLFLSARDSNGASRAPTIEVTDNSFAEPTDPTVSVDAEGFVLTAWIDRRGPTRRLFTQLYASSLIPQSSNQPVSLGDAPSMSSPVALAARGRSWFAWNDARSGGSNVYLTGYVHSTTDVGEEDAALLPDNFTLRQNYPNPFNPTTQISFTLPRAERVSLMVYNIAGQRVRLLIDGQLSSGVHTIEWDGRDDQGFTVSSGIYLYRLSGAKLSASRKMTLLK